MPMRELVRFGLAMAALIAVDRATKAPPKRKTSTWVEVADDVFANRDAFGRYIDCVDAAGRKLPDEKCRGCGVWGSATASRPAVITGCPK